MNRPKTALVVLLMSFTFLLPATVSAQTPVTPPAKKCTKENSSFLGLPTWYKYVINEAETTPEECVLDFDVTKDIPKVLLAVFEIILRLGGLAAAVFVLVGGVQYILSQGEPEKTKGARMTIINALIGLVITMLAVVIVNVIGNTII